MKIVVGTYEGNLLSWESVPGKRALRLAYAFNAHDGAVKAVALDHGRCNQLVSGAADDSMRIFNLRTHRETGVLLQHRDAVTALEYFGDANMISGGKDGLICIWRVSDWLCLDTLKGHSGAVNSLAVHPSGRMALSVGSDRSLRLWDLTKGKPAFAMPLPAEGLAVKYNHDGSRFVVAFQAAVAVHDGTTGKLQTHLKPADASMRIADVAVASLLASASDPGGSGAAGSDSTARDLVLAGCEGGDLRLWPLLGSSDAGVPTTAAPICWVLKTGHSKRVRCVAILEEDITAESALAVPTVAAADDLLAHASDSPGDALLSLTKLGAAAAMLTPLNRPGPYVITVDSDCVVKVWSLRALVTAGDRAAAAARKSNATGNKNTSSVSSTADTGWKEVIVDGVDALATLTAGAGSSRPTCLATSQPRAAVESVMKNHGLPAQASVHTATSASSSTPADDDTSVPLPGPQKHNEFRSGAKRKRAGEEDRERVGKVKGGQSHSRAHFQTGSHEGSNGDGGSRKPTKGPRVSFGGTQEFPSRPASKGQVVGNMAEQQSFGKQRPSHGGFRKHHHKA